MRCRCIGTFYGSRQLIAVIFTIAAIMIVSFSGKAIARPPGTNGNDAYFSYKNVCSDGDKGFSDFNLPSTTQFLLIGETHGTIEIPAEFVRLVCRVGDSGRDITVAVEFPQYEQDEISRFVHSRGSPEDINRFRAISFWHQPFKDGRSSRAYFEMMLSLRVLVERNVVRRVVAVAPQPRQIATPDVYERAMADLLIGAGTDRNVVIGLLGNLHARKSPIVLGESNLTPAAALLPEHAVMSLNAAGRDGTSWNCSPECGPHRESGINEPRGIGVYTALKDGFDGFLSIGVSTNASPPLFEVGN